jgi:hypothetical protein
MRQCIEGVAGFSTFAFLEIVGTSNSLCDIRSSPPRIVPISSSDMGLRIQYRHCICPLTTLIVWLLEW